MHPGDTDPMWSLDLTHRGVLPTTKDCDHSLVPQSAKQKQRSPTKMSFWSFSLSLEVCLLEVEPCVGSTLCDPSNVGAEHSTDRPEAIEAPKPNRRSRTRRLCSIWYRRPNRKQYSLKEIVPAAAPVEQKSKNERQSISNWTCMILFSSSNLLVLLDSHSQASEAKYAFLGTGFLNEITTSLNDLCPIDFSGVQRSCGSLLPYSQRSQSHGRFIKLPEPWKKTSYIPLY